MNKIPYPRNEKKRLEALKRYNILDTESEQNFDDIIELASQICDTPIAIVTLIDRNRQWFKAEKGLHLRETERNLAFCAYAILGDGVMVVNETLEDERFKDNPRVTGPPHLRFYTGVPLVTDEGYKLGTLAVLDRKPKALKKSQIKGLKILANQVTVLLNLRLALARLKDSGRTNNYLAKLVRQSLDAIVSFDENQTIQSWNVAAEYLYGYSTTDAVNQPLYKIIGGTRGKEFIKEFTYNLIRKKKSWKGEMKHFNKNDSPIHILASFFTVTNETGNKDHYVFQLKDISERKTLENQLVKLSENLKEKVEKKTSEIAEIFERVSDAFIALDTDFNCYYVNKKAEEIINRSSEEFLGKNIWEAFPEAVGSDFQKAIEEAMEKQEYQHKEIYYEPFGQWFEHHMYPSETGLSIYFRNITEKKQAEEELNHHILELEKTNYELDQFVYSVSHDLRAPLSSILGLINIAEYEDQKTPTRTYLDMIRKSIYKLDGFIKDILDYSRNTRIELKKEKINFTTLIEEIKRNLQSMDGFNDVLFHVEIEEKSAFYSDVTRVSVVLENLISNAIRYHDKNKNDSWLYLSILLFPDQAVIKVRDNGIGIEKNHLNNIFDMFYRASHTSKGSGLGLYIVKETIQKLGGDISVKSKPDHFTEFEVILPNHVSQFTQ